MGATRVGRSLRFLRGLEDPTELNAGRLYPQSPSSIYGRLGKTQRPVASPSSLPFPFRAQEEGETENARAEPGARRGRSGSRPP